MDINDLSVLHLHLSSLDGSSVLRLNLDLCGFSEERRRSELSYLFILISEVSLGDAEEVKVHGEVS